MNSPVAPQWLGMLFQPKLLWTTVHFIRFMKWNSSRQILYGQCFSITTNITNEISNGKLYLAPELIRLHDTGSISLQKWRCNVPVTCYGQGMTQPVLLLDITSESTRSLQACRLPFQKKETFPFWKRNRICSFEMFKSLQPENRSSTSCLLCMDQWSSALSHSGLSCHSAACCWQELNCSQHSWACCGCIRKQSFKRDGGRKDTCKIEERSGVSKGWRSCFFLQHQQWNMLHTSVHGSLLWHQWYFQKW